MLSIVIIAMIVVRNQEAHTPLQCQSHPVTLTLYFTFTTK